jgi:hypothetical protein
MISRPNVLARPACAVTMTAMKSSRLLGLPILPLLVFACSPPIAPSAVATPIPISAANVTPDPMTPESTSPVFTVTCVTGMAPTQHQLRMCESTNWRSALALCPSNGQAGFPALRVGDPRQVTRKGTPADEVALEMDFQCNGTSRKP